MSDPFSTAFMLRPDDSERYPADVFRSAALDRYGDTGFADLVLRTAGFIYTDDVIFTQLGHAAQELRHVVAIDPALAGGVPVIAGTEITVASVLAVMAEGYSVSEVSTKFDIATTKISQLLHSFASHLDRPLLQSAEPPPKLDWVGRLEELGIARPTTSSLSALVDTVFDLMTERRFDIHRQLLP